MKVSLNWLNDFVDLRGIAPAEIMSRLSLVTAEVEGYEARGLHVQGIVIGQIVTCVKHPTKNLNVLTVNNGEAVVPVVCGAPNCRVGLKVAFAKVGSRIGDMQIGIVNIAGHESHGMCCSALELGIGTDHDGIVEIDDNAKVGQTLQQAIPDIVDTVFEIDNKSLTNRPDLWGHYGIARELSVIFGRPLKKHSVADLDKYNDLPKVPVQIENKEHCLSYGAIKMDNVTRVKSPLSMQARLFYCGCNVYNFLVDLTNYVMLELGQPAHAFDASRVGKISIGNIAPGSKFTTLKDQEINTEADMLFIKSDGVPVALAGVIGGKNSEITPSKGYMWGSLDTSGTRDCVFELATFDATNIRVTATKLGLRTDASARYEKSLDVNLNKIAAGRLLKLVSTYDKGAKVASCFNWIVAKPVKEISLSVSKDYLQRFAGVQFNYADVKKKLAGLGFSPKVTAKDISVTVPSWRATKDVTMQADIIEEIVRTFGYDKVVATAPIAEVKPVKRSQRDKVFYKLKNLLADKYAYSEVHTYLWNDTKLFKQLSIETPSHLRVVNSCIKDDDAIRSELIPHMIATAFKNRAMGEAFVFEIGRVCSGIAKDGNAIEEMHLACVASKKGVAAEVLYKQQAEMIADILDIIGYRVTFNLGESKPESYFHPKNFASIWAASKDGPGVPAKVGSIGIVHPNISGVFSPQTGVSCLSVNLTALGDVPLVEKLQRRISKYQKNVLDFTFKTDKIYGKVQAIFDEFVSPLVHSFKLKDVHVWGDGDGALKSYTLTFTVGSAEKTLTADDINAVVASVIAHGKAHGLQIIDA